MTRVTISVALSVFLCAITGCKPADTGDIPQQHANIVTTEKIITVSTAQELADAIGSDRVIQLKPGEYDLSKVEQHYLENVYWQEEYDGSDVIIRKVQNLCIRASADGQGRPRIIVHPSYVHVLTFEDCRNIDIDGITMGHWPDAGFCTGGVLRVRKSANVKVSNCDLFGCGTEGLNLEDIDTIDVKNCSIYDCTSDLMTMVHCKSVTIEDTSFLRNLDMYGGINVEHCDKVAFNRCRIEGNSIPPAAGDSALFHINSSGDVVATDCVIRNNNVSGIVNDEKALKLVNAVTENNAPRKPEKNEQTVYYTVVAGDSFANIAKKFYGNAKYWVLIRDANPDIDSTGLKVGDMLVIPPIPKKDAKE